MRFALLIRARMRALTALLLTASLAGCGYLFGDDGVFRDDVNDYRKAEELPPIQVPEGKEATNLAEIYAIPQIEAEPQLIDQDKVPRPAPLVAANAEQLVRIQRLGSDSWALIAIAPGQLWPQLRSFLSAAGIDIARMDARAGIIETPYLELQDQPVPSRFRFRVERGVQRGNSELHILQMNQTSSESWPPSSDNVELESEMLRSVAQYIANSADTAPVSMMAEQSISATGKVAVQQDDNGDDFIALQLPFDRAWAALARSLDVSGFAINDRNRSEGRYWVAFVGDEEDQKKGWFSWIGGGDDDDLPGGGLPLLVTIESAADESMEIRLREENPGSGLEEDDARALLLLIKGNIY